MSDRITATEVKASQEKWESTFGQGIEEALALDFAPLEKRVLATLAKLAEETPDPLQEVLDELVRDSEESASRTTHT